VRDRTRRRRRRKRRKRRRKSVSFVVLFTPQLRFQ
jgi:hypothetical protein